MQREMDANGDGNISSREFCAAVNRLKGLNVTEKEVMEMYKYLLAQRQAAVATEVEAGAEAEVSAPAKEAKQTGEEAKLPETAAGESTRRWNKIKHTVGLWPRPSPT